MKRLGLCLFSTLTIIIISQEVLLSQTLNVTQALTFGQVAYVSSPSTVTVSWNNSRTSSGAYVKSSSSFTRGIVTFRASQRRNNVTLTVGNSTLNRVGGGGSLQFTGGTTSPSGVTINKNSTTTFYFGGTITLTQSLVAGNYTGSVALTFNYN